ncbi:MAG: hypothetical protein AB7L90_13680 [Hyphomicrobiaceae bacterium]
MATPFLDGDGRRARIGIVVPSVNTVMEPWAARVVPEGVSVHFSRMYIPPETTAQSLIEMDRTDGKSALRQLSSLFPHVMAYGCTASSIVQGLDYDEHLRAEIAEGYDVPATTAAHAIISALHAVGAKRISIVSPYPAKVDEAEHQYFSDAGFDVLGGAFLGIVDGFKLAEPSSDTLFDLGRRGMDPSADALVVSCLNTRSHTVIDRLEDELGKPVVTSTQATLWHAMRLAGITDRVEGCGTLMTAH